MRALILVAGAALATASLALAACDDGAQLPSDQNAAAQNASSPGAPADDRDVRQLSNESAD